jgi:fluoride exporter
VYRTLFVAAGGLVGSVARYWLAGWVQTANDSMFPLGTLAVNTAGSFILGLVMALSLERGMIGPEARLLFGAGLCGGFTTMSTFSYETLAMLQTGGATAALANVALTMALCLIAVWAGMLAGRVF